MREVENDDLQKILSSFEKRLKSLTPKDKNMKMMEEMLDDLFCDCYTQDIPREDIEPYIIKIAKMIYPNSFISKRYYNNVRYLPKYQGISYEDFIMHWKETLDEKTYLAFINHYPEEAEAVSVKKIGSMDAKEYKAQRKHAESYPIIDTDSIQISEIDVEAIEKVIADLEKETKDGERGDKQ